MAPEAVRAEVVRAVEAAIVAILPELSAGAIPHHRHLRELGADSVDRVEILLGALDRLGLDEPLARFSAVPDVASLIDLLWQRKLAS
ncbi:MAG TPA: phosphopantetheine-binding protein [Thermoanaerobaculia bacterium]|nr:phosphopantetheine-binding protein [Thermoanaerobaculia bacterium]